MIDSNPKPVAMCGGPQPELKELTMTTQTKARQWTICYTVQIVSPESSSGTTWVYAYTSRGLTEESVVRRAASESAVSKRECRIVGIDYLR